MFTSDIVPQAGVLVTVSWWTRWSRGTWITRPPRGSGVTRPTRGALAACPPFTRQACGWEDTKSVIDKKDSNMVTPGGLRKQEGRAETENMHPGVHVWLDHHPNNAAMTTDKRIVVVEWGWWGEISWEKKVEKTVFSWAVAKQRLPFSVYRRETAPSGLGSALSTNMKSIFWG